MKFTVLMNFEKYSAVRLQVNSTERLKIIQIFQFF